MKTLERLEYDLDISDKENKEIIEYLSDIRLGQRILIKKEKNSGIFDISRISSFGSYIEDKLSLYTEKIYKVESGTKNGGIGLVVERLK